jgi:hypothetical protein
MAGVCSGRSRQNDYSSLKKPSTFRKARGYRRSCLDWGSVGQSKSPDFPKACRSPWQSEFPDLGPSSLIKSVSRALYDQVGWKGPHCKHPNWPFSEWWTIRSEVR